MRIVVDAMGEAGPRKDALQGGPAASPQRAWNGSIGELGGAGKRVEGASRTTGAKVAPTPPGYLVPDATARFGAGGRGSGDSSRETLGQGVLRSWPHVDPFWRVLPDAAGLHDLDAEQRARIIHATRWRV